MPTITLQVRVKPGRKTSSLKHLEDGTFEASLKSPPVDGKANAELIGLLAAHYGCGKSAVPIKSGLSSPLKRVTIG